MRYQYLIIGQGLSGSILAYKLIKRGCSVLVVDHKEENASSWVAAGIYNPITGMRIAKTWQADVIFPYLKTFYKEVELELGVSFLEEMPIYKPFKDVAEQNDVLAKSADERYKKYIKLKEPSIAFNQVVKNDHGGIYIHGGGYLKMPVFLSAIRQWLIAKESLVFDSFNWEEDVRFENDGVVWKGINADRIIACEGHSATKNPYFSYLPLAPTKGELIGVRSSTFPKDCIINKSGFMLPTHDDCYLVGSTYERVANKKTSDEAKQLLLAKLDDMVRTSYSFVEHRVGIRPTVVDRRPLIGVHPTISRLFIFNGLGTKGVSIAPYYAEAFADWLQNAGELDTEVDINRYFSMYTAQNELQS